MPGITHWHHPNFHGYFAAANSFPAIVGEMMSAGISSIGINWVSYKTFDENLYILACISIYMDKGQIVIALIRIIKLNSCKSIYFVQNRAQRFQPLD